MDAGICSKASENKDIYQDAQRSAMNTMGETIQNPGSKLAQIVFCCSHTCNDACQLFEFVSQTDVCQNKGARRSTLNSELSTRMRRAARRAAGTSWRATGAWGTTSR